MRRLSVFLVEAHQVSERRACGTMAFHRSTVRYRSKARDQTPIRMRLRELAATRDRYGYRRLHVLLRREGWKVNHKRIWRFYQVGAVLEKVARTHGLPQVITTDNGTEFTSRVVDE